MAGAGLDRLGTTLEGVWTLDGIVGRGATSVVYSARHTSGRRAAMKVMHRECASDHEMRLRFRNEARIAARVRHPNVVDVWGSSNTDDGMPVLVSELLEGVTLGRHVRRTAPSVAVVVHLALQLLDAVQACHDAGVLHRDLKPSNVVILKNGTLKLLDFGVAKEVDKRGMTQRRLALGTPSYMAPEQARAEAQDQRTDVFGAGATLYPLFTGAAPHDGDEDCALDRAANQSPSPLLMAAPDLPRALAHAIDRAMSRDADRRWQSIAEFRAALVLVARGLLHEESGTMPALTRHNTLPATPSSITYARETSETIPPPPRVHVG